MSRRVPPYIGPSYSEGGIVLVGRDPGRQEVQQGEPFVGRAGELLGRCMSAAGIRRRDVGITNAVQVRPSGNNFHAHGRQDIEHGTEALHTFLRRTNPNIVIALGNEANHCLLPDQWPGDDIFQASGILDRRGYLWWSEEYGVKVLSAVHPASLLHGSGGRTYGFNAKAQEMLLTWDLERAREHAGSPSLDRPERQTTVVWTSAELREAREAVLSANLTASDIEIHDRYTLGCIGFAPNEHRAYVFPEERKEYAFELLENPDVPTCWQNGQFDLYFLKSREGVRVANYAEDSILAFHTLMPEMAGAEKTAAGKKKGKRTQKGLGFLASLFCNTRWFKDYDYSAQHDMYMLNGHDCMITLEVLRKIKALFPEYGIDGRIYEHELGLVWPTVTMLERGIRVDDGLRRRRKGQLEERYEELEERIVGLARPILEERRERLEKPHLIWRTVTCGCCRNGSGKRDACWSCAGFEEKPTKGELVEALVEEDWSGISDAGKNLMNTDEKKERRREEFSSMLKAELEELIYHPCRECGGEGQWEEFGFNVRSVDQLKDLLYRALRLPKRFTNKRLSTDEDALTSILSTL